MYMDMCTTKLLQRKKERYERCREVTVCKVSGKEWIKAIFLNPSAEFKPSALALVH